MKTMLKVFAITLAFIAAVQSISQHLSQANAGESKSTKERGGEPGI